MNWKKMYLTLMAVGVIFPAVWSESQTGTVSGDTPDVVVNFSNKVDSSYSIHAQSSGGWIFTDDFSWGGPNGWYSDAKYSIACERLSSIETAFVDASLCFGASMNGKMYKPSDEDGSPIAWSVSSAYTSAPNSYIYPAQAVLPVGDGGNFRYGYDNVFNTNPGGFWKFAGTDVAGNSVQASWTNAGATYGLPTTLQAGQYMVTAARNTQGAFSANAPATVVGVKNISAASGSTTVTSTTDSPGANETLYVMKGAANVTITATPEPGSAWPTNMPTWEGATGNGATAAFTPSTTGETVISATCGNTVYIKVVVVEVVSISGLSDLYCSHINCSQVVTANLTNGAELPAGASITWGGDAAFENISGRTATAKFSGHTGKSKKITAKIGPQTAIESSSYTVVNHTSVTGINDVTYNYTHKNPSDWGVTAPQYPEVDITAYFSHPDHKWQCMVTTSTCEIQQGSRLLSGVSEASVIACTSEAIYRKMRADLVARGALPCSWYMLSAVVAHEKIHSDDWIAINDPLFSTYKNAVESLSVSYDDSTCETSTKAKTAIQALTGYTNALSTYWSDLVNTWNSSPPQHPGSDAATNAAEDAVTGSMITLLDAHAALQTPAWTP